MTKGAPRRPIEPAARAELDKGRGYKGDPVEGLHRDARLGDEHHGHDPDRDRDRQDGLAEQHACLALVTRIVPCRFLDERPAGSVRRLDVVAARSDVADVVAGGLHRGDEAILVGDIGQVADRRDLRREVDVGVLDPVRGAQESLDAVHA